MREGRCISRDRGEAGEVRNDACIIGHMQEKKNCSKILIHSKIGTREITIVAR
jgi:hypothetical protein